MIRRHGVDRLFLTLNILLAAVGFLVFFSASMGLLGRGGPDFGTIVLKQLVLLLFGICAMFAVSLVPLKFLQKISLPLFLVTLFLTLLVFVPGLGLEAGGAQRWIDLGRFSFQPSEFLKLAVILYLSALLSRTNQSHDFRARIAPFLILMFLIGIILALQPDIDTIILIFITGAAMLFAAGVSWRYLLLLAVILIAAVGFLFFSKSYLVERLEAFLNPNEKVLTSSYQLNQSLIAIGSGGIFGRGFGRSVQKFKYLPEPISDSVFAVAAEEFGFFGAFLIVVLFLAYTLFGLRIAAHSVSLFGRLLAVGVVIMTTATAFVHIASLIGLIPLSGTPLIFVSHGGTALLLALLSSGMVLAVSRQLK